MFTGGYRFWRGAEDQGQARGVDPGNSEQAEDSIGIVVSDNKIALSTAGAHPFKLQAEPLSLSEVDMNIPRERSHSTPNKAICSLLTSVPVQETAFQSDDLSLLEKVDSAPTLPRFDQVKVASDNDCPVQKSSIIRDEEKEVGIEIDLGASNGQVTTSEEVICKENYSAEEEAKSYSKVDLQRNDGKEEIAKHRQEVEDSQESAHKAQSFATTMETVATVLPGTSANEISGTRNAPALAAVPDTQLAAVVSSNTTSSNEPAVVGDTKDKLGVDGEGSFMQGEGREADLGFYKKQQTESACSPAGKAGSHPLCRDSAQFTRPEQQINQPVTSAERLTSSNTMDEAEIKHKVVTDFQIAAHRDEEEVGSSNESSIACKVGSGGKACDLPRCLLTESVEEPLTTTIARGEDESTPKADPEQLTMVQGLNVCSAYNNSKLRGLDESKGCQMFKSRQPFNTPKAGALLEKSISSDRSSGGLVQIVIHNGQEGGIRDSLDSFSGPPLSDCGSLDAYAKMLQTRTSPLNPADLGITSPTKVATLRLMRRAVKEREKLLGKVQLLEGQVREMAAEKRTVVAGIARKEEEVHGLLDAQRKKERTRFLEAKAKAKRLTEEYEQRLEDKEEELFALQRKLAEMEDALEDIQSRTAEQMDALQADLAMRSSTIDTLAKLVEDKEAEITSLRAELVSVRSKIGDAGERSNQELALAQANLEDLQMQLEAERDQAQRELGLAERERASLQASIATASERLEEENRELRDRYIAEAKERRKLYNQVLELKGNIRVFCRCRPLNGEELAAGENSVAEFDNGRDCPTDVVVRTGNGVKKVFKFDRSFSPEEDQAEVFADTAPVVTSVLDGYNVCIFAYGQTGTGKTFTMEGCPSNRGVNYRTLEELFKVASSRESHTKYRICVSVLEVYNEQIRDLLVPPAPPGQQPKKLEIKQAAEGGHHVPGLVEAEVASMEAVWDVLQSGSKNRSTGATNSNLHSSRSHCMLCVMVRGESEISGEVTRSKLWLVDLAGSERVAKSEVQGDRLREAQNINKSLSALGDVIAALTTKSAHVPYRNSKLTHLLQDSLGGDAKTLMFVQISPSQADAPETLCSLSFASRVRGVELGPARKNTDSGEVFKYKQLADRAKAEARQKEDTSKKAEEGLRALEAKLKAKEQQLAAMTEKAKDCTRGQGEAEAELAKERAARAAAEAALRELQKRLEDQQAASQADRQAAAQGQGRDRVRDGRGLSEQAKGAAVEAIDRAGDAAVQHAGPTEQPALTSSAHARMAFSSLKGSAMPAQDPPQLESGARVDAEAGNHGHAGGRPTSGDKDQVCGAAERCAAGQPKLGTHVQQEEGAARSSEVERGQGEKRVAWSDDAQSQQSELSLESSAGSATALQAANVRARVVTSKYTLAASALVATPQSKPQRSHQNGGPMGMVAGAGSMAPVPASMFTSGVGNKGATGTPFNGLPLLPAASSGGLAWGPDERIGRLNRRQSYTVTSSRPATVLPAVSTGGALPSCESLSGDTGSAFQGLQGAALASQGSAYGLGPGGMMRTGSNLEGSEASGYQPSVAGTPSSWRSGAAMGLSSRASIGLDRPPLSGIKQNRPPTDYLEKFEEYKKRKAEQGQETASLGGIVPGTGVSLAVPGSESRRNAVASRLGGRTGGAQRVKTKGGGGSGRTLPPAPARSLSGSRAWQ